MSKGWPSRHNGGLVDGHCIFGEIGNDGVTRLVVRCNGLVLFVDFNTPPLGALCEQDRVNRVVSDAKVLPACYRGDL